MVAPYFAITPDADLFLPCKDPHLYGATSLHPRCLPNENAILLDVGIGSRLVFESKVFDADSIPAFPFPKASCLFSKHLLLWKQSCFTGI